MSKNVNDPVTLMRDAFLSAKSFADKSEVTFGVASYHMWHVIQDQERMGPAFKIGPEWMLPDATEGRKALKARLVELAFPAPERAKGEKKRNDPDRQKMVRWVGEAVEMLAGMARMGDMFGPTGAQWDDASKQWLVPVQWWSDGAQIATCTLSGKRNKLHNINRPVPFVSTAGAHVLEVVDEDEAGELTRREISFSPNRQTIAKLGMPKQEREQAEDASAEVSDVTSAGNMLSKVMDEAEEEAKPITGDAADALGDVIARIVRNRDLWSLVLAERAKYEEELNREQAAA